MLLWIPHEKDEQLSESFWNECCYEYLTQLLRHQRVGFQQMFSMLHFIEQTKYLNEKDLGVGHLDFNHMFLTSVYRWERFE